MPLAIALERIHECPRRAVIVSLTTLGARRCQRYSAPFAKRGVRVVVRMARGARSRFAHIDDVEQRARKVLRETATGELEKALAVLSDPGEGSPGVSPLGKAGQLIAAGGVGKTMALVSLARSVASGGKWFTSLSLVEAFELATARAQR